MSKEATLRPGWAEQVAVDAPLPAGCLPVDDPTYLDVNGYWFRARSARC